MESIKKPLEDQLNWQPDKELNKLLDWQPGKELNKLLKEELNGIN